MLSFSTIFLKLFLELRLRSWNGRWQSAKVQESEWNGSIQEIDTPDDPTDKIWHWTDRCMNQNNCHQKWLLYKLRQNLKTSQKMPKLNRENNIIVSSMLNFLYCTTFLWFNGQYWVCSLVMIMLQHTICLIFFQHNHSFSSTKRNKAIFTFLGLLTIEYRHTP